MLRNRLDNLGFICRVTTIIDYLLQDVEKELNFTAKYSKLHGYMFHDWMMICYPGGLLIYVERALG